MLSLHSEHQENLENTAVTNIDLNAKTLENGIPDMKKTEYERMQNNGIVNKFSQLKRFQSLEKVFCLFVVLIFSTLTISSTYLNLLNANQSYSNNSMPCIYHVTLKLLYL